MSKVILKTSPFINLHLFDGEGGVDASFASNSVSQADDSSLAKNKNSLANVRYGKQAKGEDHFSNNGASNATDGTDLTAEFDELIKGKYKEPYEAKFKDAMNKRFRNQTDLQSQLDEIAPIKQMLMDKYGARDDWNAIKQAIEDDDSYYEDEANERGIPVEVLKELKKTERENEFLNNQMREAENQRRADEVYSRWAQQSEKLKEKFPDFDLETELQNPVFKAMLSNPRMETSVEQAYISTHYDELLANGMAYATKKATESAVNNIMSRGARPSENGVSSASVGVVTKTDPSKFTSADLAEIRKRVMRGEKIVF